MPADPHAPASSSKLPRLLIADDDPVVRSTLSMALESRFEIVAVVEDGEQAVVEARSVAPDAALVDVDMPRGGGLRAVSGIVEACPETAIIVLSGDEAEGIVVELLRLGAMSYCRKGVETHQLAETIDRSIVAHRQLIAASRRAA